MLGNNTKQTENLEKTSEEVTKSETAHYVATISRELAKITKQNNLMQLTYLLDLVVLEARNIASKAGVIDSSKLRPKPPID